MSKLTDGLSVAGIVLGSLGFIVFMVSFIPFVLMLAWNYVMPKMFGLPEIGFLESFALTVVVGILTSSFRAATKSEE